MPFRPPIAFPGVSGGIPDTAPPSANSAATRSFDNVLLPEFLTANGFPFRQPRSFPEDGVVAALYPLRVTVAVPMTVGKLIQVLPDGTAILADAATGIRASGVVVRVETPTSVFYAREAVIYLPLDPPPSAGDGRVWLDNAGAILGVPPQSGLIELIGEASLHDTLTNTYRIRFALEPGAANG